MASSERASRVCMRSAILSPEPRNLPTWQRQKAWWPWPHCGQSRSRPINRNRIPGATYTDPGIGSVGLQRGAGESARLQSQSRQVPVLGNSKATILDKHEGFVKVIADETFGEILGVHIIGPEAFELIAEAVTAMEVGSDGGIDDGHHPRSPDHLRSRRRSLQ